MFLSCVVLAGSTFGGDARCSVLCDLRAPSCLRLHQERVCLSRGGRWQGRRYPAASWCALVLIRFDFCWGCSVARIRPAGRLSPPSCSIMAAEWFWRLSCACVSHVYRILHSLCFDVSKIRFAQLVCSSLGCCLFSPIRVCVYIGECVFCGVRGPEVEFVPCVTSCVRLLVGWCPDVGFSFLNFVLP